LIHAEPGPNVVQAYPVAVDGAGYAAQISPVLIGTRDKWFRPADVCVAPDGSLFVADWYDPGVGGNSMGDIDRGRVFRVTPPDTRYRVPRFDFSSPEGAGDALKNPNLVVRYMAWTALNQPNHPQPGHVRRRAPPLLSGVRLPPTRIEEQSPRRPGLRRPPGRRRTPRTR